MRVCTCVCRCKYTCLYVYEIQKTKISSVIFRKAIQPPLRQGLSLWSGVSSIRLHWLAIPPQRLSCFNLFGAGIKVDATMSGIFTWILELQLQASCFQDKSFTHWAILPSPSPCLFSTFQVNQYLFQQLGSFRQLIPFYMKMKLCSTFTVCMDTDILLSFSES